MSIILSNIVNKEKTREIHKETLHIIKDAVLSSFGPLGSNTKITKHDSLTKYSKDGHTILNNIDFKDPIEQSVLLDILDITRNTVKGVGDGTTSAAILSSIIFDALCELEDQEDCNSTPYELINELKNACGEISKIILDNKQEFTPQTAYDITYISTNGNTEVATNIKNIYEQYGNDVFIDVSISNNANSYLKTYEGLTLPKGYSDAAYINNNKKNICTLKNPNIYYFEDPIDTPEMAGFLNTIIEKNIMQYYNIQQYANAVPTVILAPMISRDLSSFVERIITYMLKFDGDTLEYKPPLLIVTNTNNYTENVEDITKLCGCKAIKKYINPKQQAKDQESGEAPTTENITEWCGSCELITSGATFTKFVNPKIMRDENGELSSTFNALINFLETTLAESIENGADINEIGNLKRRINALKANMVDYYVGGLSMSDRDSVRDLVEDSVLSCRSAAEFGVGFGANFEALRATDILAKKYPDNKMYKILNNAYLELARVLYGTKYKTGVDELINNGLESGKPVNILNGQPDDKLLTSIKTDVVVLEGISQILSLIFTCNQFLCPNYMENRYQI